MPFAGRRRVPRPENDPNRTYAPGTPERAELKARLARWRARRSTSRSSSAARRSAPATPRRSVMPHNHGHVLANFHLADRRARRSRRSTPPPRPAASGRAGRWRIAPPCSCAPPSCSPRRWRSTLNAATMLGQSKTAFQAEIDAASELIDFWRFNVAFRAGALSRAADQHARHVEPDGVPRRSRASSTRSRRSTSPRSAATWPPRRR